MLNSELGLTILSIFSSLQYSWAQSRAEQNLWWGLLDPYRGTAIYGRRCRWHSYFNHKTPYPVVVEGEKSMDTTYFYMPQSWNICSRIVLVVPTEH